MRDHECIAFLRWSLPKLGLRWQGFRKVRKTVCKRVDRRRRELGLSDALSYRAYLDGHPEEWRALDSMCRIPISRFWRDRAVFACLAEQILSSLAEGAGPGQEVRCWSAGCASGEEPYSLRLAWMQRAAAAHPDSRCVIVATDSDETMLARARTAVYRPSSLRDVPSSLRSKAFIGDNDNIHLRSEMREGIEFLQQDIRDAAPAGRFDLILCRNLAFTYFALPQQRAVLGRLANKLNTPGFLVLGSHESLPPDQVDFESASGSLPIWKHTSAPSA
jgi:chemotaxis protein methyltransferase CheR